MWVSTPGSVNVGSVTRTPYVPAPLLSGERLYFISDSKPVISCLDARTGRPLFDARRIEDVESVYASPVAAGGGAAGGRRRGGRAD